MAVRHWTAKQDMKLHTTFSNGYLGSCDDEERSEMRYVMRIAEPANHQVFERTWRFPKGSMLVSVSSHLTDPRVLVVCEPHGVQRHAGDRPRWLEMRYWNAQPCHSTGASGNWSPAGSWRGVVGLGFEIHTPANNHTLQNCSMQVHGIHAALSCSKLTLGAFTGLHLPT